MASKERYCRIEPIQVSRLTEFVHLFLQCKRAVKSDIKVTSCIGKRDALYSTCSFCASGLSKVTLRSRAALENGMLYIALPKDLCKYLLVEGRGRGIACIQSSRSCPPRPFFFFFRCSPFLTEHFTFSSTDEDVAARCELPVCSGGSTLHFTRFPLCCFRKRVLLLPIC